MHIEPAVNNVRARILGIYVVQFLCSITMVVFG